MRTLIIIFFALELGFAQDTFTAEHLERAKDLHSRALVLDTHSDVTPKFEDPAFDFGLHHQDGHMDIPRLRDAHFGCQFLSIWMPETPGDGVAIKTALTRIDAAYETVRKHPKDLEMAFTASEIRRVHASGKVALLFGIEGGHIIEDSLPALRMFHRLGCRYMTLTHSFNTPWADSAGIEEGVKGQHGGLTARGEDIVREMNRLGMMVDISHVSDETFADALRVTTAPVIASHSSVRAICKHRRNLSDEMLKAMSTNGGVVMINFFEGFVDPDYDARRKAWEAQHHETLGPLASKFKANRREYWNALELFEAKNPMARTPLVVLARHVEHAAGVMGWDHVGLGADWDGISSLPAQMAHCGELPNLTALLLARGASEANLEKFLGGNLLRVLETCEKVATKASLEPRPR